MQKKAPRQRKRAPEVIELVKFQSKIVCVAPMMTSVGTTKFLHLRTVVTLKFDWTGGRDGCALQEIKLIWFNYASCSSSLDYTFDAQICLNSVCNRIRVSELCGFAALASHSLDFNRIIRHGIHCTQSLGAKAQRSAAHAINSIVSTEINILIECMSPCSSIVFFLFIYLFMRACCCLMSAIEHN